MRATDRDVEQEEAPLVAGSEAPAGRRLHMIGNAHIDPVWLWQWQEGLQEVRATFRSALDLMEEYDDFIFTCDSVAYLAWLEQVEPELFDQVVKRAAEGRFVVVGGWWVEPDCNLPHGESLVRQALYSQHFLLDRFGAVATVGCNLDSFGHAATLPQLLAKSGMDSYLFLRPEPHEKALPAELFWWVSPDGSKVLAYRVPGGYSSPGGPLDTFLERALSKAPASEAEVMVLYGVGNHGGGPTKENLESIRRLNEADNGLRLQLSSPRRYFDAMAGRQDIPTCEGDLQHHAVGCYSAHSGVKRWNRRAEHLLLAAERWSAVAAQLGGPPYPADALSGAWKRVLFNQFHDTLAGTAIAPAYDDARDQFGYASAVAAEALNLAVQSVTRRISLPAVQGTVPVAVVNPLPWSVQADVEFEMEGTSRDEVDAVEEGTGSPVPLQRVRSRATLGGRHRRLVLAADVPALGYKVYRLRPQAGTAERAQPAIRRGAGKGGSLLENDHLRVKVDARTGWLSSFFDKNRGAELATRATGGHAVVLDDPSDTWGHDVVAYDKEVGRFACRAVRHVEEGPVRTVVEVESTFGQSTLVERIVLGTRAGQLEVHAELDWQERQRALKLRFPSVLSSAVATFSVPYGRLGRPAGGGEEVAQAWVDVSGTLPDGRAAGWSLLNDGKYSYDVRGAELGMTVARSPVYAWHDPYILQRSERYEYLDQGRQEFTYALWPHAGDAGSEVARRADQLNERPFVLPEHFHAGDLPAEFSFADDGDGAVIITVLKRAEDGGAFVVRAYEASGRPSHARLELPFLRRRVEAGFGPGEIKTFFVPEDQSLPVREVSLLELAGG